MSILTSKIIFKWIKSLNPTLESIPLSSPQHIWAECGQVIMTFFASDPQTFQEAAKNKKWIEAMNEEIKIIEENNTWHLVDKPQDKEVIALKWVYRIKYNEDDSI